jgi:PPOX class probable F420-dependent enzyme
MAGLQTDDLITFLRRHRWGVVATVAADGAPQAAVVGIAVTDRLELVFDTVDESRKVRNLRRDARVAVVVGWDEEQTVQLDGVADEPTGEDLAVCQATYFAAFPDGQERRSWPGITYVRVRPTWIRYSDFRQVPPLILETPIG